MPANVKLLAFDTISQPQAREKGAAQDEKDIRIGGVELRTDDEFIHLGKENPDIFHWAEGIVRDQKHPHISSWFQAEEYIRTLPKDAFNLSTGAGQIRQFGRMAILNDLSQPVKSSIWSRIREELKKISGGVAANNKLEVIIVGSFAGGTGAGMFIDMAILLREIARAELSEENNFIVRGFFVLPSAFGLSGQDYQRLEMQARAFAAWRELDRFMIKSPTFGVRQIQYHEEHQTLKKVNLRTRPFDACYLVDSHRPNNSLDVVSPEEGVFPSVSDVISAILDPFGGKHYTEHVTTNLNPIYVRHPDTPMYSAIGSFTVKVPVYYTLEETVHLFALDALETWLQPVKDEKNRVTKLSVDQNEELGIGKPGLEEAVPFLRRTRITQGDQGVNAMVFFNHVADIVSMETMRRGRLVASYAMPRGMQNHLLVLTNIGDSSRAKEIRSQIDAILHQRLIDQVHLSRELKENPLDGIGRIEAATSNFLQNRFGRRLEDGTEVRGEYGDALGQCRRFQTITFRKILAMHVENTLKGEAESDSVKARRGKVGFIYNLVSELVNVFDGYIGFLNEVDEKRQAGGAGQKIYERFDLKQKEMREKAHAKIIFGALPAPKAHAAQEEFIKAGQNLADMRRDDLLLLVARETADDMRAACIEMRERLNEWIVTLAVGTEESASLYQRVYDGLEYLRQGKDRDASLNRVQKILSEESQDDLYVQDYEALKNILGRIRWKSYDKVTVRGSDELHEFCVECDFRKGEESLSMRANNIRNIAREWLANCRREYEYIPSQKLIGDVLVEVYGPNGAQQLAEEIGVKAGPLWQAMTGKEGAKTRHAFVRVFHEVEEPDTGNESAQISSAAVNFLSNFKDQLGQLSGATNLEIKMVNSGDEYKLSLIQSDDCIPSDNFSVWGSLRKAYVEHIQHQTGIERQERAAILLHNFPSECNVAEYEARWADKGNTYEVFEPDVVMVLADKKRTKLFFLAYAMGLIKADRSLRAMVLKLPDREPIYLNEGKDGSSKKEVDDIIATLDAFVNGGQDVRNDKTTTLPYDALRPYIIDYAKEKHKSYLKALRYEIEGEEGTVYAKLMALYETQQKKKYRQLAEIARFMFEDEEEEELQWADDESEDETIVESE